MVQPLTIVPADEKADAALLEGIADWCDRFTPLVAVDAPDGLFLDITGAAHLFGGEDSDAGNSSPRRSPAQGFAVQGAIAGTSLAAHALARYVPLASSSEAAGHENFAVTPSGGEAQAVAPLPVTALECDDKTLRALRHAGLKTIGHGGAARPRSELAARLGASFVTRLEVMLGAEEKPLQPRRALPDLMAEQRFAEPIVTEEVIAASLLRPGATSWATSWSAKAGALRMLEAAFFRADGKVERIAVKTGAPLRDRRCDAAAVAREAGCAGRSAGSRFRLRPDPAGSTADGRDQACHHQL